MSRSRQPDVPAAWDTYWQGTADGAALASGGVQHPAVADFWRAAMAPLRERHASLRVVDVASGNGAVLEHLHAVFGSLPADTVVVDIAAGAIDGLAARYPGVRGVVSDARSMPLESGSADLVTSQFGVEYAGEKAVHEAARLVAADGRLCLLLHHRAGGIHAECGASLAALRRLERVAFVPKAQRLLESGFAAVRGGSRATYESAAKQMQPAVKAMRGVLDKYGPHVAGDTVAKLVDDVVRINRRLANYEPREVLGWLRRMQGELEAYAGRMASMQQAALDEKAFRRISERLASEGFELPQSEALVPAGAALPLAWALVAVRRS